MNKFCEDCKVKIPEAEKIRHCPVCGTDHLVDFEAREKFIDSFMKSFEENGGSGHIYRNVGVDDIGKFFKEDNK